MKVRELKQLLEKLDSDSEVLLNIDPESDDIEYVDFEPDWNMEQRDESFYVFMPIRTETEKLAIENRKKLLDTIGSINAEQMNALIEGMKMLAMG